MSKAQHERLYRKPMSKYKICAIAILSCVAVFFQIMTIVSAIS